MDEFLRNLALLFIGATFGPLFWRLVRLPGVVKSARRKAERRSIDHATWVERNYAAMLDDFDQLAEQMNERGMFKAGIHIKAEERVRRSYLWKLEDEQRSLLRDVEDAFEPVGIPERLYLKWLLRKPLKPISEKVIMDERKRFE